MYTVIRSIVLVIFVANGATAKAQTAPDDSYRIQLTIQGTAIEGSQERATRLVGKTTAEQEAILNEPLPTLMRESTFQLQVTITNRYANTQNYTGSPMLRYEHFGCLSITDAGVVRVRASRACSGPDKPGLWVVLVNERGSPIAYNEYLFSIP